MKIRKNISGKELWNLIIQRKIKKNETLDFLLYKKAEKHYYETRKVYVIAYKGLWFEFKKEEVEKNLFNAVEIGIKHLRNEFKVQHTYETKTKIGL